LFDEDFLQEIAMPPTTRKGFNPINAIGSKVKNIFTWFKASKKQDGETGLEESKDSP
jgi:hypothetical protein